MRNKSSEAATAAFTATAGLRGDGRRAPSAVRATAAWLAKMALAMVVLLAVAATGDTRVTMALARCTMVASFGVMMVGMIASSSVARAPPAPKGTPLGERGLRSDGDGTRRCGTVDTHC